MTTRWPFVLLASSAFAFTAEATSFSRGVCGSGAFFGLEAVGLTDDQRLVCFKADAPKFLRTIGSVSGLSGDAKLIGIDYRPMNGALYGLGDAGGVYTIDPSNAAATFLFTVVLDGKSFGVDFNPAADRLRIVSDTGQNLRINVDDGYRHSRRRLDLLIGRGTTAGGDWSQRCGIHQQRREPRYRDHALRHRRDARSSGDSGTSEQRRVESDRKTARRH